MKIKTIICIPEEFDEKYENFKKELKESLKKEDTTYKFNSFKILEVIHQDTIHYIHYNKITNFNGL